MIQIREANIEDAEDIAMLGRKTFDQSFRHVFVKRRTFIGWFLRIKSQ